MIEESKAGMLTYAINKWNIRHVTEFWGEPLMP